MLFFKSNIDIKIYVKSIIEDKIIPKVNFCLF